MCVVALHIVCQPFSKACKLLWDGKSLWPW